MKLSLIGQDIPALLPSLLTDLLFSSHSSAVIAIEERNEAMSGLLKGYSEACFRKAGLPCRIEVGHDRSRILSGADCVIYAGDPLASSRFRQDWEALSGMNDGEAGLTDQARVNAGIGGLMHSLRQGSAVLDLIDSMKAYAPNALVITLSQPISTTLRLFKQAGFRAYGLGSSPMKGPNGFASVLKAAGLQDLKTRSVIAGLPGFAWLLSLHSADSETDLLPNVHDAAEKGKLGRLTQRWLEQYGAVAIGSVPDHAERMPQQEDYSPDPNPSFGESVECRKERILWMNKVRENGLSDSEGSMAQMLLLSRAPAQRPVQLALALLSEGDLCMEAVSRMNRGTIRGLPDEAVIEASLVLRQGEEFRQHIVLPGNLLELCYDTDAASMLAARAACGDRGAIREWAETAPELEGLDRLYIDELLDRMLKLHEDILTQFFDPEDS